MLLQELESSSESWRVAVMAPPDTAQLPDSWSVVTPSGPLPWSGAAADDLVVYLRCGVRLERGSLPHLVTQLLDTRSPCGSFAWLRPASPTVFPYGSDFSWRDLLHEGHPLPAIFAVHARDLARCTRLPALLDPAERICALIAAASASGDMLFQHVGDICGDDYFGTQLVSEHALYRAAGYLEFLGLLPRLDAVFGSHATPRDVLAEREHAREQERLAEERRQAELAEAVRQAVASNGTSVDPERLAQLEQAFEEHAALKRMKPVKLMRKLRVFDVLRTLSPRSRGGARKRQ